MKKFRNRLAALERVRDLRCRAARVGLARAASGMHEQVTLVEQSRDDLRDAESAQGDVLCTGDAAQIRQWSAWCARERERLGHARAGLAAHALKLDAARSDYRAASTGVRVLATVRQRRHRAWLDECEREETRFLSETYLQRWTGRRESGGEES